MHSGGLELTTLSYTRVEDNLIRHRGDRSENMSIPRILSRAISVRSIMLHTCIIQYLNHIRVRVVKQQLVRTWYLQAGYML